MSIRRVLTIVSTAALMLPAFARADDCEGPEGSSAWASCNSYKELERVDKKLNDTYRKLMAAMDKPDWLKRKKMLVASQRAWLVYRDKDCELVQEYSGGFNKAPGLDCKSDMTEERAKYLERLLDGFK
jgi:uncharacterized protein YecT (DUF1311 family)